ncbi:MAG: quinone-dependent dihydroorotate dehydrogenase [Chloroflexota bacterium]
MYRPIRPAIFKIDPERAHHITLRFLSLPIAPILSALFDFSDPRLAVTAFGLNFRNPVGLAAGYDKNGIALRGLAALGFGHIEAGTVTRNPQSGNVRPRIFRLTSDEALVNRMGFPNDGVDSLIRKGVQMNAPTRIGINIGKSKDTPIDRAADDYCTLITQVAPQADYVAVNVSSPNTPGLRQLQTKTFVAELLKQIADTRTSLPKRVPVLVKIAPDLSWPELDDILDAVTAHGLDGIIATNTTLSRDGLRAPQPLRDETGGLSGQPLRARSTEIVRHIYRHTEGKLPIIGVGGINNAEAALEKIRAGATLVQVYTGLIYEGPGLVRAINRGLVATGAERIADLIGTEANVKRNSVV